MKRLIAAGMLFVAIGTMAGCAHMAPEFNQAYLPKAAPESPQKRIDLTDTVADKVAVTKGMLWRSVSYLPVSLYWLGEDKLLFNVRSGDDADTVLHSFVVDPATGVIRLLEGPKKTALAGNLDKRTSLVRTDSMLGEVLKVVVEIAVAVASRGSGGGGSDAGHYAGTIDSNGTALNLKMSVTRKKHRPFGSRYYACDYSIKNGRDEKKVKASSEIEIDDVDYKPKKNTLVYELKDWLRSWRASSDGRSYLVGKTATLINAEDGSSSALIDNFSPSYAALDINPTWEKIALLKIEQDRKTERVHYVIEFFPFAYRNLEQAQTTRDGDVRQIELTVQM